MGILNVDIYEHMISSPDTLSLGMNKELFGILHPEISKSASPENDARVARFLAMHDLINRGLANAKTTLEEIVKTEFFGYEKYSNGSRGNWKDVLITDLTRAMDASNHPKTKQHIKRVIGLAQELKLQNPLERASQRGNEHMPSTKTTASQLPVASNRQSIAKARN